MNRSDYSFIKQAIAASKSSRSAAGKVAPKVGVVVAKKGRLLAFACRGQIDPEDYAEYTVLEKTLSAQNLAGTTVYTTLEPCNKRHPPKLSCAERLIERKVARVVIGMLDPNPVVCGKGLVLLRDHNVQVEMFPSDFASQVEDDNRDFRRHIMSRVVSEGLADCPVRGRSDLEVMSAWPPAQRAQDLLIIGINLNLVMRQSPFFQNKLAAGARVKLVIVDPHDRGLQDVLRRGVVEQQHIGVDFDASLQTIAELRKTARGQRGASLDLRVIDYVPSGSFQVLDGDTSHGVILVEVAPNKMPVPERPHFVLRAENAAHREWYERFLRNCLTIYQDARPWRIDERMSNTAVQRTGARVARSGR